MKLNTIIRFTDGREGTICWHHLDGDGGVWGRHVFEMPDGGFGDNLPAPEFMCREKEIEANPCFRQHHPTAECVGYDYEIVESPT